MSNLLTLPLRPAEREQRYAPVASQFGCNAPEPLGPRQLKRFNWRPDCLHQATPKQDGEGPLDLSLDQPQDA
jgi:hypothetical protein